MFANRIGLDRDLSYCLSMSSAVICILNVLTVDGDQINAIIPESTREVMKKIIRLEWFFYPFTTFVCSFGSFVLHCFAIGMTGRLQRELGKAEFAT